MLGMPSSCKFGWAVTANIVGAASETIGEEKDVGATSRLDREAVEEVDTDGNARPFRQVGRDDGLTELQPRGFLYLIL